MISPTYTPNNTSGNHNSALNLASLESTLYTKDINNVPSSQYKKAGVTHAIRERLNFLDERLWKRFSARRLELIDTLELSSKKASEQEAEIKNVANTLRVEFGFGDDAFPDFDKLVRAAVQSVRRNRKRSTKSKRFSSTMSPTNTSVYNWDVKKPKIKPSVSSSPEEITSSWNKNSLSNDHLADHLAESLSNTHNPQFISEISRLNSDSQDENNKANYSKIKQFSVTDKSKIAIDEIIQPRLNSKHKTTMLPSLSKLNFSSISSSNDPMQQNSLLNSLNSTTNSPHSVIDPTINATLLNYFERSKTCSEIKLLDSTENLVLLGKNAISCCSAFIFEKSFDTASQSSIDYLRNKMNDQNYLANYYRNLDPSSTTAYSLNNETAVITLNTLIGGCIKDFGFENMMYLICESFYQRIIQDYPLISRNSIPFKSKNYTASLHDHQAKQREIRHDDDKTYNRSLNSLAAIASELQDHDLRKSQSLISNIPSTTLPESISNSNLASSIRSDLKSTPTSSTTSKERKEVSLRFLSSKLEFTYPISNSATPKLIELIENAKSAFKLSQHQMLGLRNCTDGYIIKSDFDLEKIFQNDNFEKIELEIFSQSSNPISISSITSSINPTNKDLITLSNDNFNSGKIILPPPFLNNHHSQISGSHLHQHQHIPIPSSKLKFLSNLDEVVASPSPPPPPPPVLLPKFQPLL